MDDRTSVFVDAVQATRERMYRVARMMLHTDADAEDAVSTATMIAWKQLPRLRNLDALHGKRGPRGAAPQKARDADGCGTLA